MAKYNRKPNRKGIDRGSDYEIYKITNAFNNKQRRLTELERDTPFSRRMDKDIKALNEKYGKKSRNGKYATIPTSVKKLTPEQKAEFVEEVKLLDQRMKDQKKAWKKGLKNLGTTINAEVKVFYYKHYGDIESYFWKLKEKYMLDSVEVVELIQLAKMNPDQINQTAIKNVMDYIEKNSGKTLYKEPLLEEMRNAVMNSVAEYERVQTIQAQINANEVRSSFLQTLDEMRMKRDAEEARKKADRERKKKEREERKKRKR